MRAIFSEILENNRLMPMTPLFKKLNLGATTQLHVLEAPPSFDPELGLLDGATVSRRLNPGEGASFVIAFATRQADLDRLSREIAAGTEGDAVVWMAYPKGTSKNYVCEFNRDTGWTVLGEAGFEPVRQVAIDADWSALRFRRVAFIKTLTRRNTMALSEEGKRRTQKMPDA